MSKPEIDPEVPGLIENFELPDPLGFGKVFSPAMFVAKYADGAWDQGAVVPYGPFQIEPSAKVLHYAQAVFEGFKAYFVHQNRPQVFRADDNLKRLNRSAQRLCIPEVPEALFLEGIKAVVNQSTPLIPRNSNSSLYLRPILFGTTGEIRIGPASEYTLAIIASPSALYSKGVIKVLIERESVRAAKGGMGHVKAAANYAGTIYSTAHVADYGCQMALWLDPEDREAVEELSGMNLFAVIDGKLITPKLTDTLLPGITRDSIIALAKRQDLEVREETLPITTLITAIEDGRCSEVFGAGTAAIITPIEALVEHDRTGYALPNAPGLVAEMLRDQLLGIQEGRDKDPFGWMMDV